ncbi:hypothetical protein NE237_026806 [Protea cynaroides]|uniref:Phytocyanin domain-containing protein n=1 Tax=Protea cynaroides TaxID=273540 RepID=A0A9Q0GQM1_9MAGN|nr:hypothetical protein NE237_026806 [Protea cynaroides]
MASRMSCLFGCVLIVAALLQGASAQTTHVVLGSEGWIIPSNQSAYSTWAASQTFSVGDTLVFNFQTNQHDVATVTKANYESCTKTNTISTKTQGPANITIDSAGEHYYICTFGQHCAAGQKLAINASSSSTSSPPPTNSSPAPTTSSPAPTTSLSSPPPSTTNTSSASSLTIGGFSLLLLSTAITFFY